ncbi:MAG: allantoicase [bacterium]
MQVDAGAVFGGLVDLAAASFGGVALVANDEFFAGRENLLKPGRGVFLPDAYTDQGKWMDGWESRRKRGPGHDACIIRLGVPGRVRALDIDTNHFLGNHPPFASVEALYASADTPVELLEQAAWTEIMPQQALRPGSQNLFAIKDFGIISHLRLNIFPDGGVARFRAYGEVAPGWHGQPDEAAALMVQPGEVDLAALVNGGKAIGCSDAFFGPMDNLIAPGRAQNMGGGWETRRRRGPGHDWIVVRLAAPGTVGLVEVDTKFFKGNFPDTCQLEGVYAPGARPTDVIWGQQDWQLILPRVKLSADTRHFYREDLVACDPVTHVRLSIYPDGGISRLRLFGVPE